MKRLEERRTVLMLQGEGVLKMGEEVYMKHTYICCVATENCGTT